MVLDPSRWAEYEKAGDQKFLRIIDEHKWHVMIVGAGDSGAPAFAYSTGLFLSFLEPEIIVLGQKFDLMQSMINTVGGRIVDGERFLDRQRYEEVIGNFPVEMREVHKSWYSEYPCWNQWFYEDDEWPCLQCVWPDMKGRFPWEAGCDQWAIDAQPALWEPKRG